MDEVRKIKFVLATHNKGKLVEFQEIVKQLNIEIVLPDELGITMDVEETGTTFDENAKLKAKSIMELTKLPTIADDSGLCCDGLDGAPGIYSARYGGLDDDMARCRLVLENLRGSTTRAAHFHTTICCIFPNGDELFGEGDCPGAVAFAPIGDRGFGYDPIFLEPTFHKTFAQMTLEEKNSVSHRGKAMKDFTEKLKEYLTNHGN